MLLLPNTADKSWLKAEFPHWLVTPLLGWWLNHPCIIYEWAMVGTMVTWAPLCRILVLIFSRCYRVWDIDKTKEVGFAEPTASNTKCPSITLRQCEASCRQNKQRLMALGNSFPWVFYYCSWTFIWTFSSQPNKDPSSLSLNTTGSRGDYTRRVD